MVHLLNWDWAGAETEFRRAIARHPTNAAALRAAGRISLALGHWDDAERQFRTALTRDPLNRFSIQNLGDLHYCTGRYAEAEEMYRKVLELALIERNTCGVV